MSEELFSNKQLKGIGVSSGITAGKVRLLDRGKISVTKESIKESQTEREISRFRNAVQTGVEELKAVQDAILDDYVRKHAYIIDAHMMLLQDEYLSDNVIETIRKEKINAEWALDIAVSRILESFEKIEDAYIRER